ncbi:MAG: DUF2490 domain-containing protein [Algoriphagus sp.]|uniref:DUF2490 domain-containing protein n=1 Tax=Algoriphagus sp. TaxID=1872435 RepID=UPI001832C964|nr:DUF2490 domain-containing protein [Algoriphagus sp.]NVJ86244.1 DUF2490 domain-containing protein [Algoriphagus sp.]
MRRKDRLTTQLAILLSIIMSLSYSVAEARKINTQFWFNYALKAPISEKFFLGGDMGSRGLISNPDWNQFLVRPTLTYKLSDKLSLSGAVAWFGTYFKNQNSLNEYRLHQGVTFKTPDLGIIGFFYRLRIEERFFYLQENMGNTFNVRVRGLIGVNTKDITWLGSKRPIFLQSMVEGFQTLDKNSANELFVNQTRVHLAIGHKISSQFRYEFHYIAQRSRVFNEDGFRAAQNVLRLRLFHRLN